MTDLIACLSTGKGTWGSVSRLINTGSFEHVFLITNDFGKEKFSADEKCSLIVVDSQKPIEHLTKDIVAGLQGRIKNTEVALNLSSGTGKEHMAILSAVLQLGLGIRLVNDREDGFAEV